MSESNHYPRYCIGTDLFEYTNKPYRIMVDYLYSYPWIRPLRHSSTLSVIDAMMSVLSELAIQTKFIQTLVVSTHQKNLTTLPLSMTLNIVCHHRSITRVTVNQNIM